MAVLSLPAHRHVWATDPVGLQNPGFEDGILDGSPAAWNVTAARDAVRVVDAEGPSEFGTYADRNITVEPRSGDLMLRLGTPKRNAQSQVSGSNAVAQTFYSGATTVTFSLRVFSWEHRGHDTIYFDLRDLSQPYSRFPVRDVATGNPLRLTMPDGTSMTCAKTPCQFPLDTGESGTFYDSGWLDVEISGLPDDHRPFMLSYKVRTERNTAHPTWAYFDEPSAPATDGPVARFTFAPTQPLEADFVQFIDQSTPPDDGTIVSWSWEISGPGVSATSDTQHAVFSFPDEGEYSVRLTVTDDSGRADSVVSGAIAQDGTPVPAVIVQNASARVSALNVEALAGTPAPLFGRFADPGWQDTHSAQWSIAGAPAAQVLEENEPSFATGIATGNVSGGSAGSVLDGTVVIEDEDGGVATDAFEVRILGTDFDRREPNDGSASAPVLPAGWRYISDLSSPLDIDVFEVVLPDGSPLVAGSEVLVTLDGLGADYDLALLTQSNTSPYEASPWFSSPWFSSPWFSSPWFSSPWFSSPWFSSPWFSSPWLSSPWFSSPWFSSPWFSSPWLSSALTFEQLALSTMAYSIPAGNNLNAADVSLLELGLAPLADENLQVVGHSANRGTASETVLVRVPDDGQRIFIAIAGYNGAYTQEPYAFTVEASRPLDLDAFLGAGCDGAPLVTAGATSAAVTLYDHAGADLSLIVTQRERMMALYGLDAAGWDALLADLIALANHPSVAADIVSVPSSVYDAWDSDPCSIAAANATADAVRDVIVARMTADPGKRFVVLAGNDDVIPHRRVPDATAIGNEREYLLDSFVVPGSPLFASMQQSQFLSDDFYGDPDPQAWQGRELFVPDWELGRLVETPAEIRGAARAFLDSDGRLAMSTALVTGYDFFQDGAHAAADNLATALQTERIISDDWTADALRCRFLGEPPGADCDTHDVNAPFAHFTHYGALAARGFNTQDFEDYISSQDVASAGGGAGLTGSLTFTIGCHAGLSVPDRAAVPPEAGLPVDASLDLAQAMARQRAVLVGNTGFGLGDSETVAGNEELMTIFAEELARGGTAGTALRIAKQRYLLGLASLTVYEEKASVTTTFYGLPQYVAEPVGTGGGATIQAAAQTQSLAPTGTELTVLDGAGQSVIASPLTEHVTDKGSFYSAHGVQATAGRPLQPRLGVPLPEDQAAGPVHGVVVLGGTYTDLDPFDPVIAQPQQEWQVLVDELQACAPAFWPSVFAVVNSLPAPEGLLQNLVVIPAQFRCTSGEDVPTTGVERLFDTLVLGLRRSTSDDFTPPVVNSGGLSIIESSAGFATVTVDASDESGIAEIVVYVMGGGVVTSHTTGPLSGSGPFSLDVPVAPGDRLVVQVVDGAGNVASLTGKGILFDAITVDASVVGPVAPGQPVTFTTHVTNFTTALASADEMWFVWDFGDGNFEGAFLAQGGTAESSVVVNADGSATFNVTHTYGPSAPNLALTRVVVTDDAGRIGTDNVDLQLCGQGATGPNTNGEPMPLPKPVPSWDDATNPAGDDEPDVCDADIDGDGLTNSDDVARGLSAFIWDTDGDRTADGAEVACGSNPLSAVSNLTGVDTDADGLPDACESVYGTNPNASDSDHDGVRDGVEVRYWLTNPLDPNTDDDDCGDGKEIASVDSNRVVNSADLGLLAAAFGQLPPEFRPYDGDGNGVINAADLGFAASQFGPC